MKVVGISGSARKNGNTVLLINTIFEELSKEEIETELIQLYDKKISGCQGCFNCKGISKCAINNDDFNVLFEKMVSAEGIILGSPVYSADVSSQMKAFLDRAAIVVSCNPQLLKHKVGAGVAAARRGGGMTAVDTINHFFLNKEMFVVGSTYWNMVYGKDIGDVVDDKEGINNMKNLGENMAWLLKKINK